MFSFDLRNAMIREHELRTATPSQNVHGQWFCLDKYFGSEAEAMAWLAAERAKLVPVTTATVEAPR